MKMLEQNKSNQIDSESIQIKTRKLMKTILTLLRRVGEFVECGVNEKKTEVMVGDVNIYVFAVIDCYVYLHCN